MSPNTPKIGRHTDPRLYLFPSESVSEGHSDKLADRISDSTSTSTWDMILRQSSPQNA
jgi:S-adenosylmethionine synthetase